jgi:predicted lipoprotein with Yx(FWY)xxD motif
MKRYIRNVSIPALALAVAAIATSGAAASHTPARATSSSTAKVEIVKTKLGKVLADGRGRTLYLFEKDKGSKSA